MKLPKKELVIALDYDDTFTADKDLWTMFVDRARKNGHEVRFVTFRKEGYDEGRAAWKHPLDNSDILADAEELGIRIVFCGHKQKRSMFAADIWIDDSPELIPSYEELNDAAQWAANREDFGARA